MAFRRRAKSYPLFSQEFLIHNHADIGFCLVLCVLIALMFEVRAGALPPPGTPCTSPWDPSPGLRPKWRELMSEGKFCPDCSVGCGWS
uniref:Uncharacterized protein n=1 Tax=Chelonoidis abingdonii TaxID=106734 RepID=A0A8C0G142_CHEAB